MITLAGIWITDPSHHSLDVLLCHQAETGEQGAVGLLCGGTSEQTWKTYGYLKNLQHSYI